MNHILTLLFNPFGRIGRVSFVLLSLGVFAAAFAGFFLGIFVSEHRIIRSDWVIVLPPMAVLLLPGFCLLIRRCHDVGLSIWLTLAALLPRPAWMASLSQVNFLHDDGWVGVTLLLLVADLALFLVLGFWPGQPGPNQHGPVPD